MRKHEFKDIVSPILDLMEKTKVKYCKNKDCCENFENVCMQRWVIIGEDGKCGAYISRKKIKK